MIGAPVRVHSLDYDDLAIAHVPWPISEGDVLELRGQGPMFPLRVVELIETGQLFPIAALVRVAPAPTLSAR